MLLEVAPDVWVHDQPLRFFGVQVGTRMTVIRLADGGLFIHSPTRPSAELFLAVEALGPVRAIVAPNRFHHLFIGPWIERYPGSHAYAAPDLPAKRPDLNFNGILDSVPPEAWAGSIHQTCWGGSPALNEVAFFHPQSRTLVLTDSLHNFGPEAPASTRMFARLLGAGVGPRTTLLDRFGCRDHAASRASLEMILSWDFDRIIVGHGRVLEEGGRDALREAYHWLP